MSQDRDTKTTGGFCCADFWQATQSRTDNEGYGELINVCGSDAYMGSRLPPINFCPWCGHDRRNIAEVGHAETE